MSTAIDRCRTLAPHTRGALPALIVIVACLMSSHPVIAEESPVKDGPVWVGWYAHVDEGKWSDYMKFLNKVHRLELNALKKKGLILGYQILQSDARSPDDWNLAILLEYKNMAALDVPAEFLDAVEEEASKSVQGLAGLEKNRLTMRRVVGMRTFREVHFTKEGAE